jgi:hypothetical protein
MWVSILLIIFFLAGTLVGNGLITNAQDKRCRQQAAVQRDLSLQFRLLREQQEADDEELQWLSKQQTGMEIINYEITNEAPRRNGRHATHYRGRN